MEIVRANESQKHRSASSCTAHEYAVGQGLNIARIEINGRYPESGFAMNSVSEEIVYVMSGLGSVFSQDVETSLSPNDVIRVAPGEFAAWEGNMSLIIACSPAWNPTQYEVKASQDSSGLREWNFLWTRRLSK